MKISGTLLVAASTIALFTGCSANAEKDAAPATPEPLPLTSHVMAADALPGFTTKEAPKLLSVAEFAKEHEKDVAELEEAGMLSGAAVMLAPASGSPGTAMSLAVQYADDEAAEAEAARLFASNSEAEEGTTATPVDVPGIPGAKAVKLEATQDGQQLTGIEVVFVEGGVLHELFAFAPSAEMSVDDIVAAATDLFEEIDGRPVAATTGP